MLLEGEAEADGLNEIDSEILLLSDPVAERLRLSLKLILALGDCDAEALTEGESETDTETLLDGL